MKSLDERIERYISEPGYDFFPYEKFLWKEFSGRLIGLGNENLKRDPNDSSLLSIDVLEDKYMAGIWWDFKHHRHF